MRTITTVSELRNALMPLREQGKRIGFVPTMGALHEGHRALVRLSKQQSDVTVVSVFVNPSQFGPSEDFAQYPRTLDADARALVEEGVEFLFTPDVNQIYPPGHSFQVIPGPIASLYEGARRPGHFGGVATVVAILFNIVQPHASCFGQKDAQQVAVIKRMIHDMAFPIKVVVGPTIREKDGLALSSRNRFLNAEERREAVGLSETLGFVRKLLLDATDVPTAISNGIAVFRRLAPHGVLDYLDVVDSETFQPITSFEAGKEREKILIIAASFGAAVAGRSATRLIDNLPL